VTRRSLGGRQFFEPASVRALPALLRVLDQRERKGVGLDTLLGQTQSVLV